MDDLRIVVPRDSSREIAYTNKSAGVFYTETNGHHRSAWQGWRIMSTKMMDDYAIAVDGKFLEKSNAAAEVFPHQLVRTYANGVKETVTLIDSIDALVVQLDHLNGKEVSADILFGNEVSATDFETTVNDSVLLVCRKNHLHRTAGENYPVWLGMIVPHSLQAYDRKGKQFGNEFSPASLHAPVSNHHAEIIFVAGDTQGETIDLAYHIAYKNSSLIEQRKHRLEELVNRSYIRTDNSRFNKALNWAKISLDALIMNQRTKGIFAGLPWFDDYWGRDSFISLPGATLVTGNFHDAKEILYSFARWQDTNSTSTTYGRIPNLVTTSSIAYNTADGTPRFVIALLDYIRYSGDTSVVRDFWPVVKRSIEGTILYHTDSLGFLTHGEAESWMDAVGPEGAWSPRGNRANDVQALWFQQLKAGCMLARLSHHNGDVVRWAKYVVQLSENFRQYFVDPSGSVIYDHLFQDGSHDTQLRPNQLFTVPLLDSYRHGEWSEYSIWKTVTENLVYPYGVASLWQEDLNFHPYHHYSPFYVQDAAYHNGTVWTWLAGQWISLTIQEQQNPDLAYRLTDNMVHQILDRGAVGTLSELLDAVPRPHEDEPRLSGTFSQAWSLAEFIKSFYQDYMGIRPEDTMFALVLNQSLPGTIRNAEADVYVKGERIGLRYSRSSDADYVEFFPFQLSKDLPVHIRWPFASGMGVTGNVVLHPHTDVKYRLKVYDVTEITSPKEKKVEWTTFRDSSHLRGKINLASPHIRTGLRALAVPSFPMLTNADIKHSGEFAKVIYDAGDPVGDDTGTGKYLYPTTVNLKLGSMDITRCTVRSDDQYVYFTLKFNNLSDPGWHPEYGFQLTYAAIAIDKDCKRGSGQIAVGMNAHYTLDSSFAFENIIYVGGGFRVENDIGKILAEYLPVSGDEKNPLGNTQTKTIEFSVPIKILGAPTPLWRYSVLIGCQDDHGGAGIGEFRAVGEQAGEWTGGGKTHPDDPNIYDVLLPIQK